MNDYDNLTMMPIRSAMRRSTHRSYFYSVCCAAVTVEVVEVRVSRVVASSQPRSETLQEPLRQ